MKGFQQIFIPRQLTVGIFFPITSSQKEITSIQYHASLAQLAEALGFAALWIRDAPLSGELQPIFDPWVYLSYLAAHTESIALATGSLIFPLRHPLHIAKAATSLDYISQNRLVMGITDSDHALEYPAFRVNRESRGERFRQTFYDFQQVLKQKFPVMRSPLTNLQRAELFPKSLGEPIPVLVTSDSEQSLEWIAEHADGLLDQLHPPEEQEEMIQFWHTLTQKFAPSVFKPYAQFISIELTENPDLSPEAIEGGYRLGSRYLLPLLHQHREWGVNHLVLNLQDCQRPADVVLTEIADAVLPNINDKV